MRRMGAFALLLLLSVLPAWSSSFVMDYYAVRIDVDRARGMVIRENFSMEYTEPSHGFYRDIQYRFKPYPLRTVTAEISNIKTNVDALLSYNGDYISLRLGDPDEYVFGPVYYHIMYDYLLEDDGNRDYDEWYVNLLSPAWNTDVRSFSFSVTFPYEVDPERVWVT